MKPKISKISKIVTKRSKIMTKSDKMGNIEGKKRSKIKGCQGNSIKLITGFTTKDIVERLKELIPLMEEQGVISACWDEHSNGWDIRIMT